VPPDWETLPDDKLEILCRAAVPVAATPARGAGMTHGAEASAG
jgi:hypothetical protein